jgi:primosomal replication protein N
VNTLKLTACITELTAQRYTPAGIPAADLLLDYEGESEEAGQMRKVKFSIKAVALGSLAETIRKLPIGSSHKFTGFLAATRNGKGTVFHIQAFE